MAQVTGTGGGTTTSTGTGNDYGQKAALEEFRKAMAQSAIEKGHQQTENQKSRDRNQEVVNASQGG